MTYSNALFRALALAYLVVFVDVLLSVGPLYSEKSGIEPTSVNLDDLAVAGLARTPLLVPGLGLELPSAVRWALLTCWKYPTVLWISYFVPTIPANSLIVLVAVAGALLSLAALLNPHFHTSSTFVPLLAFYTFLRIGLAGSLFAAPWTPLFAETALHLTLLCGGDRVAGGMTEILVLRGILGSAYGPDSGSENVVIAAGLAVAWISTRLRYRAAVGVVVAAWWAVTDVEFSGAGVGYWVGRCGPVFAACRGGAVEPQAERRFEGGWTRLAVYAYLVVCAAHDSVWMVAAVVTKIQSPARPVDVCLDAIAAEKAWWRIDGVTWSHCGREWPLSLNKGAGAGRRQMRLEARWLEDGDAFASTTGWQAVGPPFGDDNCAFELNSYAKHGLSERVAALQPRWFELLSSRGAGAAWYSLNALKAGIRMTPMKSSKQHITEKLGVSALRQWTVRRVAALLRASSTSNTVSLVNSLNGTISTSSPARSRSVLQVRVLVVQCDFYDSDGVHWQEQEVGQLIAPLTKRHPMFADINIIVDNDDRETASKKFEL